MQLGTGSNASLCHCARMLLLWSQHHQLVGLIEAEAHIGFMTLNVCIYGFYTMQVVPVVLNSNCRLPNLVHSPVI